MVLLTPTGCRFGDLNNKKRLDEIAGQNHLSQDDHLSELVNHRQVMRKPVRRGGKSQ